MKNKPNLIGISGKAGSGKSLIGKVIQYLLTVRNSDPQEFIEKYLKPNINVENPSWEIKMFAGKVKEILSLLTGISVEDFEKEEVKSSYLGEEWNVFKLAYQVQTPKLFNTRDEAEQWALLTYNSKCEKFIIEIKITVRQALQWIGTDLFRDKFHPNTWVNALFADYKPKCYGKEPYTDSYKCGLYYGCTEETGCRSTEYPNWIVTDTRFPNEVQAVKDRDGVLIRVDKGEPELVPCSTFYYDKKHREQAKKDYMLGLNVKMISNPLYKLSNHTKIKEHKSETALDNYTDWSYVIENNGSIEDLIEKVKEILIKENLI